MQNLVYERLVVPSLLVGMSDTKWLKIAERISKVTGNTLEEILEEYDKQFTAEVEKLGRYKKI